MSASYICRVIFAIICVVLSLGLISCESNNHNSTSSETTAKTDTTQEVGDQTTTAPITSITENETTVETTITMIKLGDYGISLSEYREQKEQARLEELDSKEQIGNVIINTKDAPLNLRESPNQESKSLDQIPKGTIVPYFAKEGDWYLVEYMGAKGYVNAKYVVIEDTQSDNYLSIGSVQINTKKDPLTLRESPDKNSKALDRIPKGTIVQYLGQVDEWLYVTYHGKFGYIHSDYVIYNP